MLLLGRLKVCDSCTGDMGIDEGVYAQWYLQFSLMIACTSQALQPTQNRSLYRSRVDRLLRVAA